MQFASGLSQANNNELYDINYDPSVHTQFLVIPLASINAPMMKMTVGKRNKSVGRSTKKKLAQTQNQLMARKQTIHIQIINQR